jgi:hypothetical protein
LYIIRIFSKAQTATEARMRNKREQQERNANDNCHYYKIHFYREKWMFRSLGNYQETGNYTAYTLGISEKKVRMVPYPVERAVVNMGR